MRSSRKLLVACGIGCIVGAQIVFTAALATRNGIRIHSPQPSSSVDRSLVVSGDAWMKSGITSVVVFLAPVGEPSSVPISAAAQRDEVRYRGRVLYPLSSWSAKIQSPSEGEWRLWARAVGNDGSSVETIEGEAREGKLSAIQQAFHDHHAVQCGYCTAGMVMSVRELIDRNPKPSVDEIKNGIEGNCCHCTGYEQSSEAVLDVTGQLKEKGELKHA